MQVSIFKAIRSTLFNHSRDTEQFTLPGGKQDCISVQPAGQVIEVLSGAAWIACCGEDCELRAGGRYTLPKGGDAALISALGDRALVFRLLIIADSEPGLRAGD